MLQTQVLSQTLFCSCLFKQFFVLLQVKMWVQLLIPRIEDGNNFGVSIQEETVAELRTVEGEAASYLDQISRFYLQNLFVVFVLSKSDSVLFSTLTCVFFTFRYYITRAKLVSKIAKYPHVVSDCLPKQ